MKDIFAKRRFDFNQQCIKYLRYVFNDHFVIVLFVLLGFLLVQYSNLLQHFPKNHWPILVGLGVSSVLLLWSGRIATYLEPADQIFYLPKEKQIVGHIRQARLRSFILWGSVQTLFLVLLAPLFLALGFSKLSFSIFLILMLLIKAIVLVFKSRKLVNQNRLNWTEAIQQEQGRRQSILKFYSLFTRVKGISSLTKRRAYLDGLLARLPRKHSSLWSNLYLRAYLRSGDYLGLSLRLLVLSLLSIGFIRTGLIGVVLSLLFNYLLLFQLLALANHYDYQYLTQLFPLKAGLQKRNFKQVLRGILYVISLIEVLIFLTFAFSWQGLVLLCGLTLFLVELYLPYKLKKMIDEA
ncbi:ABC transporter permease [Streptococcus dentasini]